MRGKWRGRQELFRHADLATNSVTLEIFTSLSEPHFFLIELPFCCCDDYIRSFLSASSAVADKSSHEINFRFNCYC